MLTTQDFLKLLQGLQGQDSIQDVTQLRYVIYARKSTTESEERQVRSLGGIDSEPMQKALFRLIY